MCGIKLISHLAGKKEFFKRFQDKFRIEYTIVSQTFQSFGKVRNKSASPEAFTENEMTIYLRQKDAKHYLLDLRLGLGVWLRNTRFKVNLTFPDR